MRKRRSSVFLKIMLIGCVPIALFVAVTFLFVTPQYRKTMYEQKEIQLRNMVDVALAVASDFHSQFKDGALSEEEAQKAAMQAIKSMTYGDKKLDYFWINDFEPRMIMHPFKAEMDGTDLSDYADPNGFHLFVEFANVCKAKGAGFVKYYWQYYNDANRIEPKLSYVAAFKPWNWIIGTGVYIDDVDSSVRATTMLVLLATGVAALITFLVIFLLSRSINTSLKKVMEQMSRLMAGDLTGQLDVRSKDEFGQLMSQANATTEKLRDMVRQLRETAEHVAGSGAEIASSAQQLSSGAQNQASTLEETSASVEELTASVEQVSDHAQSQAASVEESSSNMHQMQSSVQQVSKTLNEVSNSSKDSMQKAQAGMEAVRKAVEAIKSISASAEKIAGIINVISDIADQTNLLALNASIEAARAGEHGRGFAVVADEVSKLADRSSSSTKEIEGLIKESGKNVTLGVEIAQAALSAMEAIISGAQKTNEMVGALAADIDQQVGAIKEVAKATESISEMSQSISAATEEQTTNAKQVVKAIENVNELTQHAASAAEEMTAATEELSTLAQQMQRLVEQFRLSDEEYGRALPQPQTAKPAGVKKQPIAEAQASKSLLTPAGGVEVTGVALKKRINGDAA